MSKREKIYERPLSRPLDEETKLAISRRVNEAKDLVPVPIEARWVGDKPMLIITSKWISWTVAFTPKRVVVFAEVSSVGRFLDTKKNRRKLVELLDSTAIAENL